MSIMSLDFFQHATVAVHVMKMRRFFNHPKHFFAFKCGIIFSSISDENLGFVFTEKNSLYDKIFDVNYNW
jgi:hypothetical protein